MWPQSLVHTHLNLRAVQNTKRKLSHGVTLGNIICKNPDFVCKPSPFCSQKWII